jgi:hypothetical protein
MMMTKLDQDQIRVYLNGRCVAIVDTEAEAWAVIEQAPLGTCYECRSTKTGEILDDFIPW